MFEIKEETGASPSVSITSNFFPKSVKIEPQRPRDSVAINLTSYFLQSSFNSIISEVWPSQKTATWNFDVLKNSSSNFPLYAVTGT